MYHEFFGLIHRPFVHGPAEHFFSFGEETTNAVARLQRVLTGRDSVSVLSGGPGVGKSALLYRAAAGLDDAVTVAHVDTRQIESEDLLNSVLVAMDPEFAPSSPLHAAKMLRDLMKRHLAEGRQLAVSIDVNTLTLELAKGLMRIAHIAGSQGGQLTLVVQGPHALHQQFDLPALIQLRQRVSFRHRVRPLTLEETDLYIRQQIRAAGGDDARMITHTVSVAVYCFVAGVPRLINTLMDTMLGEAHLQGINRPDGSLVKQSADALGWKPLSPATQDLQPAKKPMSSIGQNVNAPVVELRPPASVNATLDETQSQLEPQEAQPDFAATGILRLKDFEERSEARG